jgi:inhibitor of KinA sporulation pathway (predicted exonuclease)
MVINLEATCSDKHTFYRHEMETIEIGAVILNRQTWEIDSEFQQFIKPVRNPILTEFWGNLTTIFQKQVDTAPQFPEVMPKLAEWMSSFPNYIFCPWGNYETCNFYNIASFIISHILLVQNTEISKNNFLNIWVYIINSAWHKHCNI